MGHKFTPQNWERLLSNERRRLLDPDKFLDGTDIREGDTVADIGAGPGFFTLPLAERVGPTGKVYALDVAPEMVDQLKLRGLPPQVEILLSGESSLPLPDAVADIALLAFVLHEVHDQTRFLAELRRVLRPAGRLVLLEWIPQEEPTGPPLHERIAPEDASRILTVAGFRVLDQRQVNGSHYSCMARMHPRLTGSGATPQPVRAGARRGCIRALRAPERCQAAPRYVAPRLRHQRAMPSTLMR